MKAVSETQTNLYGFTISKRKIPPLKGDDLKKKILGFHTPEELLVFLQSRNFTRREFYFLLERVLFVYSQMKKVFFTDNLLWVSSRLFNNLLVTAGNFDRKNSARQHRKKTIEKIEKYVLVINALTEFRANEVWDEDHLWKMFCISMDKQKLNGPIMKKYDRIVLMAS